MSASAIIDGLITALTASSAFGSENAGYHYGVLESTSGSCAVVSWINLTQTEETFANVTNERDWTFSVELYAKDTGNPVAVMSRLSSCIDTFLGVLEDDRTLQGTVERITEVRGTRPLPPDGFIDAGGATWAQMLCEVDAVEWPAG
jgi:hypothetical protein